MAPGRGEPAQNEHHKWARLVGALLAHAALLRERDSSQNLLAVGKLAAPKHLHYPEGSTQDFGSRLP